MTVSPSATGQMPGSARPVTTRGGGDVCDALVVANSRMRHETSPAERPAGLHRAAQGIVRGSERQLRVTESKGVVVEGNVRDNEGRIVGRKTVDAHRNEWQAVVTERELAAERQVEQQRVR